MADDTPGFGEQVGTGAQLVAVAPEELTGLRDCYPREMVDIAEWGRAVWVWAHDLEAERRRWLDIQMGGDDAERINRGMIRRVIEAVRIGGELGPDGKLPQRLFSDTAHWGWLSGQPVGVIRRICEVSERLNGEAPATQEQVMAFFALLTAVARCCVHTASACGSCTDCPQSSRDGCPRELCRRLSLPTP